MRGLIFSRFAFFAIFLSLLYLAQRFWFVRGWQLIGTVETPRWRHLLQGVLLFSAAGLLLTVLDPLLGHFIPRQGLGHWVIATTRIWLLASFLGFVVLAALGVVERLSRVTLYAVPSAQRANLDHSRRRFFSYAALALGSVPFFAATYGFGAGRLRYRIEKVEVPVADLPQDLDGLRILQLSDIHTGDFMPISDIRRAVEMANELKPDLAVVTGDFINDENDPLEGCIRELSRLRAPLGIWGCNGNHEIYADAEDLAQELFHRYGMRMLRQQNTELEFRGARFNLIGVDYQRQRAVTGEQRHMLRGIEPLVRRDIPNILLSHNPNSFYRAAELGIQLSLAGHTHGGQIRVEILDRRWSPARFISNFVAGLYELPMGNGNGLASAGPSRLYVNRGLGTFGVPVRVGVPPEITLLTLRAA